MSNHQSSYSAIVYKIVRNVEFNTLAVSNTESEGEMFSEIRPSRGSQKIRELFHMTSRKQTVQAQCIRNEQQPNSLGYEDRSDWQRRKTRLRWLMRPSTQRIGKVIRISFYFSTRRVVDLVPEACSIAMTVDRHDERVAIDLSMIAVAPTPSRLVWILTVMPGYIFHPSCFVFENETLYTIQVLAMFDFYYRT